MKPSFEKKLASAFVQSPHQREPSVTKRTCPPSAAAFACATSTSIVHSPHWSSSAVFSPTKYGFAELFGLSWASISIAKVPFVTGPSIKLSETGPSARSEKSSSTVCSVVSFQSILTILFVTSPAGRVL